MLFFDATPPLPPPQQAVTAEIQDARQVGPPRSAMQGGGTDIKRHVKNAYTVVVVIKGEPITIDMDYYRMIKFGQLGGVVFGIKGYSPMHGKYAPFVPTWMDTSTIMSGPNKVQRVFNTGVGMRW